MLSLCSSCDSGGILGKVGPGTSAYKRESSPPGKVTQLARDRSAGTGGNVRGSCSPVGPALPLSSCSGPPLSFHSCFPSALSLALEDPPGLSPPFPHPSPLPPWLFCTASLADSRTSLSVPRALSQLRQEGVKSVTAA